MRKIVWVLTVEWNEDSDTVGYALTEPLSIGRSVLIEQGFGQPLMALSEALVATSDAVRSARKTGRTSPSV